MYNEGPNNGRGAAVPKLNEPHPNKMFELFGSYLGKLIRKGDFAFICFTLLLILHCYSLARVGV